jgi:hypothetical protein
MEHIKKVIPEILYHICELLSDLRISLPEE